MGTAAPVTLLSWEHPWSGPVAFSFGVLLLQVGPGERVVIGRRTNATLQPEFIAHRVDHVVAGVSDELEDDAEVLRPHDAYRAQGCRQLPQPVCINARGFDQSRACNSLHHA